MIDLSDDAKEEMEFELARPDKHRPSFIEASKGKYACIDRRPNTEYRLVADPDYIRSDGA